MRPPSKDLPNDLEEDSAPNTGYRDDRVLRWESKQRSVYQLETDRIYSGQESNARKHALRKKFIAEKIERLREFQWEDDLLPSEATVKRAKDIWSQSCTRRNMGQQDMPSVTAAEDNSIDIFWGNRNQRLLVNVPDSSDKKILAHLIDDRGETIVYFTDNHYFNIASLLKELRDGLD